MLCYVMLLCYVKYVMLGIYCCYVVVVIIIIDRLFACLFLTAQEERLFTIQECKMCDGHPGCPKYSCKACDELLVCLFLTAQEETFYHARM
jgi:hypothetical protein